jgi:hypothetical protein
MQGFVSVSGIERSACNKMLRFTIWTVFFANVLTGSALRQFDIFLDPKEIPSKLAVVVPAQVAHACLSSYFGLFEIYHRLLLGIFPPFFASYLLYNFLSCIQIYLY